MYLTLFMTIHSTTRAVYVVKCSIVPLRWLLEALLKW